MRNKIDVLWNYLKIFAFRNSETILEQVGVILCLLERTSINPDIDYDEFEILFKRETWRIFENQNEILIRTEIFFEIPSPVILKKILSSLEIILKKNTNLEIYLMLIECYKREKKIKKNREVALYEFQFILKECSDIKNKDCYEYNSKQTVLFCRTSLGNYLNRIKTSRKILKYEEYELTKEEANILYIKNTLEDKKNKIYTPKDFKNSKKYNLILMDMSREPIFLREELQDIKEIYDLLSDYLNFSGKLILIFPFDETRFKNIEKELFSVCHKVLIFSRENIMDSLIIIILTKIKVENTIEIIRYIKDEKIEKITARQEEVMEKIFEDKENYYKENFLYELIHQRKELEILLSNREINKYKLKELIDKERIILKKMEAMLKKLRREN